MDNENKIYITDDDGVEHVMEVILTFAINGKNYVIVKEPGNEEDAFVFTYDDDHNLEVVEDEDELNMAAEVLAAFEGEDDA